MTLDQSIFLNIAVEDPDHNYTVSWEAFGEDGTGYDNGVYSINPFSEPAGNVMQFKFFPGDLVGGSSFLDLITGINFKVYDDTGSPDAITRTYAIWLDKRCQIEHTEVLFMDRMGSILSFACQLREKESGTITREQFKQNVTYNEDASGYGSIYNLWERGSKITSVNVDKEIELNTNWMNNEMSLLFEELLTSPYTWIKQVLPATNELPERINYLACIVKETSFQVEKQKNKRLIRKTFTVKLANENIINI
jgi:hypothetical protein